MTEPEEPPSDVESLLVASPLPAVTVDADGEVAAANEGAAWLLDAAAPADLVGTALASHVAPDDRDAVADALAAGADGDAPGPFRVRLADGDGRTVVLVVTPGTGEGGVRVTLFECPDAQRREIERYETVLESLQDAVYAIEPDGTIVYVNDRYAEMKGVPREELLGTDIYEWVTEETAEKARAARREGIDEGSVGVIEYDFLRADGETVPVEMRFNRATAADEEVARVGVIRDVSEREAREAALRRKNERLAEFASIVSHDLRNPLNVAVGRLDLAREAADSEDLRAAASALDRIDALIDDLLTLAREGEQVGETAAVDLAAVARESWETVATDGATLRVETARTVEADESRLRQLLENLFRNSVEHASESRESGAGDAVDPDDPGASGTADGPDASGTADGPDRSETAESPGSAVTVTVGDLADGFFVADDGPGIPEANRDRVFDAGYSTDDDGTGLGLRIVEQIAGAHGWSVRATAADDGGARFEVTGVGDA